MKLTAVSNALTRLTKRPGLVVQKYSPEILTVIGIGSLIGGCIMACRATLHLEEVVGEAQANINCIRDAQQKIEEGTFTIEQYTPEMQRKDLTVVYIQNSVRFVRLYGMPVALVIFGISCMVGANGILKKRNVALMAAYKALEEGFDAYRKRVVEEFGEDKDYALRHGLQAETVTEIVTDEDGKQKKVKKEKFVPGPDGASIYARYYDKSCKQWSTTPEYNLMFLKTSQAYFNNALAVQGHVFLNEVYDQLGIPRTQAGQVVGWVKNHGDDFIDFGLSEERARQFVQGYENEVLLDFNVDGVVWDLI